MHEDANTNDRRPDEATDPTDGTDESGGSVATAGRTAAPATGDPAIDEVLRSLEDLESRPLAEHVEVFESAHERLRGALSEAGDTGHEPPRG